MKLVAAAASLFCAIAATPAAAIDIFILGPPAGQFATGEVDLVAEVISERPIREVVFRVDGREIARRTTPPFSVTVDVGQDNVEHLFEVSASDEVGEQASASRRTPALRIDEEIELELQQLYVSVTRGGERVLDVDRAGFEILDNGEPQKIVTFSRGDVPITAVLVLDTSLSMKGRRLRQALSGAKSFVDGIREGDEASLLMFSDRLLHLTRFTNDSSSLASGLERVEAGGGSAINDHLYLGLKLLEGRQGRQVVILLSDGGDIESALGAEAVKWAAERSKAMIYWIRPRQVDSDLVLSWSSAWRNAEEHRKQFRGLERLVAESGGRIVEIDEIEEAPAAFGEILADLRYQYVIGYYPSNRRDDGSWHRTRVRLLGASGTVRARQGYVDR